MAGKGIFKEGKVYVNDPLPQGKGGSGAVPEAGEPAAEPSPVPLVDVVATSPGEQHPVAAAPVPGVLLLTLGDPVHDIKGWKGWVTATAPPGFILSSFVVKLDGQTLYNRNPGRRSFTFEYEQQGSGWEHELTADAVASEEYRGILAERQPDLTASDGRKWSGG